MKISKVRFWARVCQVTFWLYQLFGVGSEYGIDPETFPHYTNEEVILSLICLTFAIIFSEAIVRLIILFAKGIHEISFYIKAEGTIITNYIKKLIRSVNFQNKKTCLCKSSYFIILY